CARGVRGSHFDSGYYTHFDYW
nr:immunoglobulin heavy chain junction region [Macaca mulatta]MOX93154.1 immunoglobulin heavy chain junction region [Macaca mulatta]MOX95001.1 immunoglobulin heavy chain junction region [Macaca mulatta]MOX95408.1 immunoglobulin heavy chain junction region [Macaca mulatta]MOX96441.1 immunoglobulin heavy chain junction region [Macaca mulatta]